MQRVIDLAFLFTGTGEAMPDDADYWKYDEPGHGWGDCIFMYAYSYDMEPRECDDELPFVCELH